jgi:hypothetical protein
VDVAVNAVTSQSDRFESLHSETLTQKTPVLGTGNFTPGLSNGFQQGGSSGS